MYTYTLRSNKSTIFEVRAEIDGQLMDNKISEFTPLKLSRKFIPAAAQNNTEQAYWRSRKYWDMSVTAHLESVIQVCIVECSGVLCCYVTGISQFTWKVKAKYINTVIVYFMRPARTFPCQYFFNKQIKLLFDDAL